MAGSGVLTEGGARRARGAPAGGRPGCPAPAGAAAFGCAAGAAPGADWWAASAVWRRRGPQAPAGPAGLPRAAAVSWRHSAALRGPARSSRAAGSPAQHLAAPAVWGRWAVLRPPAEPDAPALRRGGTWVAAGRAAALPRAGPGEPVALLRVARAAVAVPLRAEPAVVAAQRAGAAARLREGGAARAERPRRRGRRWRRPRRRSLWRRLGLSVGTDFALLRDDDRRRLRVRCGACERHRRNSRRGQQHETKFCHDDLNPRKNDRQQGWRDQRISIGPDCGGPERRAGIYFGTQKV